MLHLAFAGVDARWATSGAASDNHASIAVSRKLGCAEDGTHTHAVRGRVMVDRRFRLDRAAWEAHRSVPVEIEGLEPCLELLGVRVGASRR